MTIFYLDACLPTSVGTLNAAAAVRPVGAWGIEEGGRWKKKLENSFERFHRRGVRELAVALENSVSSVAKREETKRRK